MIQKNYNYEHTWVNMAVLLSSAHASWIRADNSSVLIGLCTFVLLSVLLRIFLFL